MSRFKDRTRTALMVIDVQNDVVATAYKRDEIVANINSCVEKARAAGVPVIWVQHSDEGLPIDSEGWEIVSELAPNVGDPKIRKTFRSSFVETDLAAVLAKLSVSHLVITGAETNNCVRFTSHNALELGYDLTLVEDAHTTSDFEWENGMVKASQIIDEQNASFAYLTMPDQKISLTNSADLLF